MSLLFSDLQQEVKNRAIRNESGTEFDNEIKTAINNSIFRISRDAHWTVLRRINTFDTKAEYTTGTLAVSVTSTSKNVTVTGATFITDGVEVGRRVNLGGSTKRYHIVTITGETTFTTDLAYDGTTSAVQSYKVYGKDEYTLPAQVGKVAFLWHEYFSYPVVLNYNPSLEFMGMGTNLTDESTPTDYYSWEENMALRQPNDASIVSIVSSSTADTTAQVTVFGLVSGYPDQETMILNGTTIVNGAKSFTKLERIVKDASTTGRVTVSTNSANVTIAVLPTGDTTAGILYKKVRIWPCPDNVFPINVWYYKQPYRLVNDDDAHELGQEFDEAIILLATAKIRYQNNSKEGDRFLALYTDELKSLRKTNGDKLDFLATLKRPEESRRNRSGNMHPLVSYSQLGSYFGGRA